MGTGPNFYWAVRHTLRCLKQGKLWETRTPGMVRHPGGNTMPETWLQTARFAKQTMQKLTVERSPTFLMREPDQKPPFHADNDACYFCNPMDLFNWGQQRARPGRFDGGRSIAILLALFGRSPAVLGSCSKRSSQA